MLPSIVSYQLFQASATSDDPKQSTLTPVDDRATEYFRENIRKVETPEDLISDFRLYTYAMRAFNLDDQVNGRAIVQKALEGGVEDRESFANTWPDGRFREMARVFGFGELGAENMTSEAFADFVVEQYEMVTQEVNAGEENPAVRLAAFFKRQAADFTTWFQPLSGTAMREVIMTTLQVPQAVQVQPDLEGLVRHLESKFDIEDFQDPEKLDAFIEKFLILYDLENGAPSSGAGFSDSATALTLLSSSGGGSQGGGQIINLVF